MNRFELRMKYKSQTGLKPDSDLIEDIIGYNPSTPNLEPLSDYVKWLEDIALEKFSEEERFDKAIQELDKVEPYEEQICDCESCQCEDYNKYADFNTPDDSTLESTVNIDKIFKYQDYESPVYYQNPYFFCFVEGVKIQNVDIGQLENNFREYINSVKSQKREIK